jgi:hypothetical protein
MMKIKRNKIHPNANGSVTEAYLFSLQIIKSEYY